MTDDQLKFAINFATKNERDLITSEKAGCYYCLAIYPTKEVKDYLANERTALCPKCGIDSVIPSSSPIELNEVNLKKLNKFWF